jgi:hypothetical protein
MAGGLKKWFMLQVWRLQQVAAILTLVLLALNLAIQLYDKVSWRGGLFENSYTAVPLIMLVLVAAIWGFSVFWDLRMKMWREQMSVTMERNPYAKEKMYAKEISGYAFFWLPVLENLGKTDPQAKAAADSLRSWINKALLEDPAAQAEWKELLEYIGKVPDHVDKIGKK